MRRLSEVFTTALGSRSYVGDGINLASANASLAGPQNRNTVFGRASLSLGSRKRPDSLMVEDFFRVRCTDSLESLTEEALRGTSALEPIA